MQYHKEDVMLNQVQKDILLKKLPPFRSKGRTSFQMYKTLGNKTGKATPSAVAYFLKKNAHFTKDSKRRLRFTQLPSYLQNHPQGDNTHAGRTAEKYD